MFPMCKHLPAFHPFTDFKAPRSVSSCKVLFNGLVRFQKSWLRNVGLEPALLGEMFSPINCRMFPLIVLHMEWVYLLFPLSEASDGLFGRVQNQYVLATGSFLWN